MIKILLAFLTLFYFIVNSYEDLKKREVWDFLNFSFIFLLIILGVFYSIFFDIDFIQMFFLYGFLSFSLGSFLYLCRLWGFGDVKFLIWFGFVISFIHSKFLNIQNYNFTNFINLFFYLTNKQIFVTTINFSLLLFFSYLFIIFLIKKKKDLKILILLFSLIISLILLIIKFSINLNIFTINFNDYIFILS